MPVQRPALKASRFVSAHHCSTMTQGRHHSNRCPLEVPFHLTHSCYDPVGDLACGRCDSCLIRREGFSKAGVEDPTAYAVT